MATAAPANPVIQSENKNPRRKKGKPESATATPPHESTADQKAGLDAGIAAGEAGSEHPYLKELQKTVRNVKKKIAATQKVDSIIAENPGKSLDELLSSKLINADQKLQAERKPALQAQLRQLEEQFDHFKKFEDELRAKFQEEKSELERTHAAEIEKLKNTDNAKPQPSADQDIGAQLLHLSKFLRTAAARRQDADEDTEENRAFEGALLQVYGGDAGAVKAMQNVISGSEDFVPTVEGTLSNISYKQIKEASTDGDDALPAEGTHADGAITGSAGLPEGTLVQTDPTVAHAGLTEINSQGGIDAQTNGTKAEHSSNILESASIAPEAANATADASWNRDMSASVTSGPDGWVEVQQVPRDPAETDTGLQATPAANTNTQSWAEDVPTEPVPAPPQASAPANDGFHEVTHRGGRGRGGFQGEFRGHRGRGGFRGDRGEGGGYRGRGGFRGDRGGGEGFRGRGRGGFRGPRGGRGDSSQ